MRNLKLIEHMSLDGVVQNSADENGFPYTDWSAPYRTPAGAQAVMDAHGDSFDLLLGRRTYDMWATFWPAMPANPIGDRINAATKYVVTHRPESLEWGPAEGVGPDVVEGVRRLKEQDGPGLVLSGSSTLISTVIENGLVDEALVMIYPVLLGTGKRLFAEGSAARSLELAGTTTTPSGIIVATYRGVGSLQG